MPITTWSKLTDLPDGHPDIASDLDKRYRRTYMILTKATGEKSVVYYAQTHGSQAIELYYKSGDTLKVRPVDMYDLEPFLPTVGYYNTSTQPFYLIKQPDRQWKRSFSNHIYQIQGCVRNTRGIINTDDVWWEIAEAYLNPRYAKLDDISIELFANVALNKNFAVQMVNGKYMLIFRQQPVAELQFKDRSVIITHPPFHQEIMDLFKYTGICTWTIR